MGGVPTSPAVALGAHCWSSPVAVGVLLGLTRLTRCNRSPERIFEHLRLCCYPSYPPFAQAVTYAQGWRLPYIQICWKNFSMLLPVCLGRSGYSHPLLTASCLLLTLRRFRFSLG